MRPIVVFVLIVAAGGLAYLLGARAVRKRYRELAHAARAFWNDPHVAKARVRALKSARKATDKAAKASERDQRRAVKALA